MKKNMMMRLASFLLVAVLISTSAISGTYAKYTTQDGGDDEARVAKWGVELQVFGNLYGEDYKDKIVKSDDTSITVQSNETDVDVVAPGTLNAEGFNFSLNGQPEVSGEITATLTYENIYLTKGYYGVMVEVDPDVITADNYHEFKDDLFVKNTDGSYQAAAATFTDVAYYTMEDVVDLKNDYYPVEYAMNGTTTNYNVGYATEMHGTDTLKAIAELVAGKLGTIVGEATVADGATTVTYKRQFAPNTELDKTIQLEGQNIAWKWDFCQVNDDKSGDVACDTCKADTILGNLMAGKDATEVVKLVDGVYKAPVEAKDTKANDYNLKTQFSLNITVTQVD